MKGAWAVNSLGRGMISVNLQMLQEIVMSVEKLVTGRMRTFESYHSDRSVRETT